MSTPSRYERFLQGDFVTQIWGKRPSELPLPNDFQFVPEPILVRALQAYTERPATLRKTNILAEFVTAIDNVKTPDAVTSMAMSGSDASLDEYISRVDTAYKSGEWSIAYFGLHGAIPQIWDETKAFLDTLHSALGYRPAGRVDVDCFVGRYSSTPSGIHVDGGHNFALTYRDGKTMYTWPSSRSDLLWLKSPEYDKFKLDSLPLTNSPRYLCYFPFDYLHVAETKSRPSVNLNVSIWEKSTAERQNVDFLLSRLELGDRLRMPIPRSGKLDLDPRDHRNLVTLHDLLASDSLERQMALADLLMRTTANMMVPRPLVPNPPALKSDNATFYRRNHATLQWYATRSRRQLLIAGNGHCVACEYDPGVVAFLEDCSKERASITRRELAQKRDLEDLLELFLAWGVFEEK
jgi:hypothetical protein